jgi:shikimate kinase
MAVRDPLYRETADIIASTEGRNTQAVVQDVCRLLEKMNQ